MKAIRMHAIGEPDVLSVDEIDVPEPGQGEVLVKVEAAGVTYGDIMKRQGAFGEGLPLPAGLGLQVAGTVAGAGEATSAPAPGTRVMAWVEAGYADYALASAAGVVPLPDTVDLHSASVLPVHGVTAYQTLRDAGGLRRGESVLVHAAAGSVGSLAVQLARLLGGGTVIGTAGREAKLDHVRGLGASAVDYTRDDWPEEVLAATDGRGVDLVLDSVGGRTAERSLECLAPFGRMVTFGAASGSAVSASGMSLMHNNLSIIGYSIMGWLERPAAVGAAVEDLVRRLAAGELEVTVGASFPLDKADEAHRTIGAREAVGMTVLRP